MDRKPVSAGEGGVLTTGSRAVYEAALTLGHHPDRLAREVTDPELLALAATGLGYKTRMPVLAAAIGRIQLEALTERNAASAANADVLADALAGAPVTMVPAPAGARRGWYRLALWITQPVPDPALLLHACQRAKLPVRPMYPDWLSTPLLADPHLLSARFPHLRHSIWQPPEPDALPNYYAARRQLLLLKLPDVPAADYLAQVADVLTQILDRHL